MCLIHDCNFCKASFDRVISLDILECGIIFNILFILEMWWPVLKLKISQVTDRERELRCNGRSIVTMETESNFCTFVERCSYLTNIQKSGFSGDQYSWNSRTLQCVMMFWIGFSAVLCAQSTINDIKQIKIRFWSCMLVDIPENSTFPGDVIVKRLH